jgi:hypothetical protein
MLIGEHNEGFFRDWLPLKSGYVELIFDLSQCFFGVRMPSVAGKIPFVGVPKNVRAFRVLF